MAADKLKKIDKEYVLTDDSVNCYGFRLLTSGYDLASFQRSPIGFYMHDRDGGVVVRWDDFRVEGDKVYAKPCINLSNVRGEQTAEEVENGFLNAASIGRIIVLDYSDDPELKLPGQTGVTITRWRNQECSLVDIPGNDNAYSLLDEDEKPINLADLTTNHIMSKPIAVTLSAQAMGVLKLADGFTPEQADQAIQDLAAENTRLTGDLSTANQALTDLKTQTATAEVAAILEKALADKKTTVAYNAVLKTQFAGRPADLKALVDAMPAHVSVVQSLSGTTPSELPDAFKGKTYDDLHSAGTLADLKAKHPEAFKELYKSKFGKEPQA